MEQQFIVDQVHSALSADSSSSTHAMSHDVYSPSEIRSIFDTISYAKAASILRMIEKSYGSKIFYKALVDYLDKRYVSILQVITSISLIDLINQRENFGQR